MTDKDAEELRKEIVDYQKEKEMIDIQIARRMTALDLGRHESEEKFCEWYVDVLSLQKKRMCDKSGVNKWEGSSPFCRKCGCKAVVK